MLFVFKLILFGCKITFFYFNCLFFAELDFCEGLNIKKAGLELSGSHPAYILIISVLECLFLRCN